VGVSILDVDPWDDDHGRRTEPDPIGDFFDQLGRRGHEPVLEEADGIIRFDLRDEHGIDHWFVLIRNGDVQVSREDHPADCIVYTDRATFDMMVTGQLQTIPAWLRNLFWVEGDPVLWRSFHGILPGPAIAHDPRDFVSRRRQRR
jgi:hypothetical protein